MWFEKSKTNRGGLLQECYVGVAEEDDYSGYEDSETDCDDDEVSRLDTMCTSTTHGDAWLKSFSSIRGTSWTSMRRIVTRDADS